jgi:hypothetical protein
MKMMVIIIRILTPVVFVATFALAATSAQAEQRHGGGGHGGGRSHGVAVSHGGVIRGGGVTVSRGFARPRSYPVYRVYRGGMGVRGRFVDRGDLRVARRFAGPRRFSPGYSSFYRPYYSSFYRPYYSFRPRLSLGLGSWSGYPVAFPYYYAYPYGYRYPYRYVYGYAVPSYGYPAQPYSSLNQSPVYPTSSYPSSNYPDYGSSGQVDPAQQAAPSLDVQRGSEQPSPGGVSFEITPETSAVFVDGTYVGTAGTFGATSQPLGLIPGRHHIEIRALGYRTMTFDVDVISGQVIPYRGTLQRN